MRFLLYSILTTVMLAVVLGGCSGDIPKEKRAVNDLRVPVETVHSWIESGRDILFVDVRTERDWRASSRKIPGAVRVKSYQGADTLVQTLSRDRLVVAYCT